MLSIEVGKPFPFFKMPEGILFDYKDEGFNVLLGINDIQDYEAEAFKNEVIDIFLALVNGIIFIIIEFQGVLGTYDAPFHIALSKSDFTKLKLEKDYGYTILLFLIDTKNNNVRGIRMIGLNHEFSKTLKILIDEQMKKEFNDAEYSNSLSNIYNKMSTASLKGLSTAYFSTKYINKKRT